MSILQEVIDQQAAFDADLEWFIADYQKVKRLMVQREAEIARLRAKLGDDGSESAMEYSFDDLARRAKSALNLNHGWQTNFERQSGYSHSTVENWKVEGLVPEGAILACSSLTPTERRERISWKKNADMVQRVEALYNSDLTYEEIAERMSAEYPAYDFGGGVISGCINNNGIKARRDARDKASETAY